MGYLEVDTITPTYNYLCMALCLIVVMTLYDTVNLNTYFYSKPVKGFYGYLVAYGLLGIVIYYAHLSEPIQEEHEFSKLFSAN